MDDLYRKIDGVIPPRHYPRLNCTAEDYTRLILMIAERTFEGKCRALLQIQSRLCHSRFAARILHYRNRAVESRQYRHVL